MKSDSRSLWVGTSCILQQFVGYNKCIKLPGLDMAELTLTLKLPFYRLNAVKAIEFERLTLLNTQIANELLELEKSERKKRVRVQHSVRSRLAQCGLIRRYGIPIPQPG